MSYAGVIGLVVFTLASLGFFVWCWLQFGEDRRSHPIYREVRPRDQLRGNVETGTEKRCA